MACANRSSECIKGPCLHNGKPPVRFEGKEAPDGGRYQQKQCGARLVCGGLEHIWLPYAQMKTAAPPLAVARTEGSRIVLADGRELIDGIASWWTACHGYNHPHIRQAVERQLADDAACDVRRAGA